MKTIEVENMIKYVENAPKSMNLLFIGDSGVGKTVIIEKYAKENDIELVTLVLSQLEASETLGVPLKSTHEYKGVVYKTMEQAIPMWVFKLREAIDEGKEAWLFLDEFLNAQPDTQNAFLNFLSSKKVNGIDLSDIRIVAATNIGEYTFEPSHNILSRFCMFEVINTTYKKYLKSNIRNDYTGIIEDKSSVVFQKRALKPRCEEWLLGIQDKSLLDDYYQGFTNKNYDKPLFDNIKMDGIFRPFVVFDDKIEKYSLPDNHIGSVASMVVELYPRMKKAENIYDDHTNSLSFTNKEKLIAATNLIIQRKG